MDYLFKDNILNWDDWGRVYRSIGAFEPIIKFISENENISLSKVENTTHGTNAVFKITTLDKKSFIYKIFAPKESGMDTDSDYKTELFGMKRANSTGISAPKLIAAGDVLDKYSFRYLIMEYIDSKSIGDKESSMSDAEKYEFGKKLRYITDKLNTRSERFNNYDIIKRALNNKRWDCFPEKFKIERSKYLEEYIITDKVYVHGDLNPNNILIDNNDELYIIDFADAVTAPIEYEWALVACELFCLEKPYMDGFFGQISCDELTRICICGLLMHDYGANVIKCNFGKADEIGNIKILKERIIKSIEIGQSFVEIK